MQDVNQYPALAPFALPKRTVTQYIAFKIRFTPQ